MSLREPKQFAQEIFTEKSAILAVKMGDTATVDAFGRQRVVTDAAIFDSSFEYDTQPLLWQTHAIGGGKAIHDSDKRAVVMSVTGDTGLVIRQTYAYHPYQKGKSQRVLVTFVLGAPQDNTRRRVGYFDGSDGVFLEQDEYGLWFVLRSSVSGRIVDTRIHQRDWNVDNLDGSGPSGIILDAARRQILDIDMEWLGVGRVRFGFNIEGKTYHAHYINNANTGETAPYMRTATLPLRNELENLGGGSAATLIQICASVFSEGGDERDQGIPFSASNGAVPVDVTTRQPVLTIRPKATFNNIENRGEITPHSLFIHAATNSALVELVYGGLLFAGTDFASVGDHSITEYDVGSTIISGGYVIQSMYVRVGGVGIGARGVGTSPILSRLPLALDINGENPLPLSIVCTSLNATSSVTAAVNWDEAR